METERSILRLIGNATSSLHALVLKIQNRRRQWGGFCTVARACRLRAESAGRVGDAGAGASLPGGIPGRPAATRK